MSQKLGSKPQRNMPRLWKSAFGGSRAGRVWSLRLMTRRVCCIDIDVQHNEAEVHHTPTNDRREKAEARATQLAGTPVAARHRVRKKCGNVSTRLSFPQDVYSFLQDTSYERAKDVQEFQDAFLSLIRRGGFGLDGQDAADLAFAEVRPRRLFLAWPLVELTPVGEQEEPSLEYEAKRARFEVDLEVGAAMKRVETAMEQQHGGELAELDEIGMASGQPPGKEDKAQRRDPATKGTEVESGQPQGDVDRAMRRDLETEATEETEKDSVQKKKVTPQPLRARQDKPVGTPSLQWTTALSLSRSFHRRARLGPHVPSVFHRGQPTVSALTAPALKRHKGSGLESISGMGKPLSKHRPR